LEKKGEKLLFNDLNMYMRIKDKEIYMKALLLAVPMMIQYAISNAVCLVDNLMVGSLDAESMTAVSIVGQLVFVFNLAIFGGLSGPGIYGAQYYGQGNKEDFKNVFRLKVWICTVCCLVGIALFFIFDKELINLYIHDTDSSLDPTLTLEYARDYMRIMLSGFIPFAFTQIYAGSLRETGQSHQPMWAGIVSVVVDIIFNYLLIYGKFGLPEMKVEGAGIATVLARFVELFIIVMWVHIDNKKIKKNGSSNNKDDFMCGVLDTLRIPKEKISMIKKILIKSLPIFLNEFLWAGAMAALTQCYAIRGLSIIAGINISNMLCNLLNVVFIAMGGAVGIIIGQYLGASEFDKAKRYSIKLMWFTGAMCIVLSVILISLSGFFPTCYKAPDITDTIRGYATNIIKITAIFFPIQGFLNALYFTLRSGGKTVITFLFDSVYTWVIPVVIAFILCRFTDMNIFLIYAIVQAADIIKLLVGYILIKKGVWINNLAIES